MASFFTSSIGKKFIQSVSGAFLVIFLLLHGTINFFSVIDSAKGQFGSYIIQETIDESGKVIGTERIEQFCVVADDKELYSTGDGYFKLGCDFMSTSFIDIMVPILALGFILHICFGIYLTVGNLKARGGLKRYEVASKAKSDSWSARNMVVLGIIILGCLGFHLFDFWSKMQLQDFIGGEAQENPYLLLLKTFESPVIVGLYIFWFAALWLHLNHGFWSMFQTIGWNNKNWMKRLKVIGIVVSSIIVLLFVSVAINAFIEAHSEAGQALLNMAQAA